MMQDEHYKLCVYVPETHLDILKQALFEAGAGKIGNYDSCCWQVKGVGQFRPLKDSSAFIGEEGKLEHVDEYKVEILVSQACKQAVVSALYKNHPYEEPAFDLIKVEN